MNGYVDLNVYRHDNLKSGVTWNQFYVLNLYIILL
jgi:hypothetical protein